MNRITSQKTNREDYNADRQRCQFNENREMIEQTTELETEATYISLNQLLTDFTDAKATSDKKDFGKQIRLMIDDIIFKMRKSIDNRNEE